MNASDRPGAPRHLHFVTGRLAEAALRSVVAEAARALGFQYSIGVMPITVAALMTPRWLLRHWEIPTESTEVIVPGYCDSGIKLLRDASPVPVRVGPRDLRELPEYLGGQKRSEDEVFAAYDVQIIAEINHAPRLSAAQLLQQATALRGDGADVIDIGCDPGDRWLQVADAVRRLVAENFLVSIDTFDIWEAAEACRAGASLVLSVNSQNRRAAADWGTEVVAVPDTPDDLASLDATVDQLARNHVPMRLDPILEPIGMGLTASLQRYMLVRQRYPQVAMMMGIGNLTELTDVDSAGVNMLLLGICQELSIRSVLTTQVINWARSSVRECDLARRLVHYAVRQGVPPKRLSDQLVMLRDPKLREFPPAALETMAAQLKDNNYRLYAQQGAIHLLTAGLHLEDRDPFRLLARLLEQPQSENLDAGHAFYLGFEMAKALTALTLGKQYEQDESLHWGHLTVPEQHHRLRRTPRHRPGPAKGSNSDAGPAKE